VILLHAEGISFSYPTDEREEKPFDLQSVDLSLKAGEVLGILGPNGSGKSTLLRLLGGRLSCRQGKIRIREKSIADFSSRALAREIALVPQEMSTTFVLTVRQMVSLGLFPWNPWFGWKTLNESSRVDEALRQTDLWELRERLTSELSGGERRRVLLARALVQKPSVLLLDEPTAHLDPRHQADFIRLVDKLRSTRRAGVIVVLHDVNLAMAWCSSVLVLKDGKVRAYGEPSRVIRRDLIENVYEMPAEFKEVPGSGRPYIDFFHLFANKGEAHHED
jgi:ABC-type cobalamin/Fe3+-siderophores transport system ATPase subunit